MHCSLMQALQAGWRAKVDTPSIALPACLEDRAEVQCHCNCFCMLLWHQARREPGGWWRILGGGWCGWCCCGRTRQLEGSPCPCRNGQGLTLVVYYDDDVYWHERLVLWKLSDSVWYVLTPDLDLYGEDLSCSGCEGPSIVKVKGMDFKYWSRVGITFWFGHGLGLGKSSALHTFELVYFHVIFH